MVQANEKVGGRPTGLVIDDRVQLTDETMRAKEFEEQMERIRETRRKRKRKA